MNVDELRKLLESKGYEVKNIRTFKNSFHVNYWTKEAKIVRYVKCPIESLKKGAIRW